MKSVFLEQTVATAQITSPLRHHIFNQSCVYEPFSQRLELITSEA